MNRERVRRSGTMAAIAAFALVALAACGNTADEEALESVTRVPEMSDAAAQATREGETGATPGAEGDAAAAAVEVTIESHDIAFEPNEVTIPANTDVKIILPNLGAAAHDFSVDALDIQEDIAPGATKEVVINAPAGEYEFYCNVPGHKEAGMVGTLIVSEEAAAAPAGTATPATPAAAGATPVAGESAATPVAEAEQPAAEAGAATPVEVVSHDIFFEPTEITIPANTDVTFTLPNEGVTAHDFSIDELGIQVDIAPGATEEVVVNAPAGTYEFYCNVPGHKAAGMVGTLTVTEDAAAAAPAGQETAPATTEAESASPEAAPAAPAATPAEATAEPETAGAAAAEAVEVVSHDIYFEPAEITIPADSDVTFSLPNEGVTMHDFSIDELGIQVDLPPGETQEITVNAPAGAYEYYCNVPGHKAAGMVGTLTVE